MCHISVLTPLFVVCSVKISIVRNKVHEYTFRKKVGYKLITYSVGISKFI